MTGELRHGRPKASRNDQRGFDKHLWPGGLHVLIYDDGKVKLGSQHASVTVTDVHNYREGSSAASGFVIARFVPVPEHDQDQGDDHDGDQDR